MNVWMEERATYIRLCVQGLYGKSHELGAERDATGHVCWTVDNIHTNKERNKDSLARMTVGAPVVRIRAGGGATGPHLRNRANKWRLSSGTVIIPFRGFILV